MTKKIMRIVLLLVMVGTFIPCTLALTLDEGSGTTNNLQQKQITGKVAILMAARYQV